MLSVSVKVLGFLGFDRVVQKVVKECKRVFEGLVGFFFSHKGHLLERE